MWKEASNKTSLVKLVTVICVAVASATAHGQLFGSNSPCPCQPLRVVRKVPCCPKPPPCPPPVVCAPKPPPCPDDTEVWTHLYYPTGQECGSILMLTRSAPKTVRLNTAFDYQLKLYNLTSATIKDIVVCEQMPAGFTVTKISPQPESQQGGVATWSIAQLGPKKYAVIHISGVANTLGSLP